MKRDNVSQKSKAEYIDREALRDALYDADAITMRGVAILNQFPAADVVPVRHGRWKKSYADHEAFGVRPFFRYCSECHEATVHQYNYCPNCGAYMRNAND